MGINAERPCRIRPFCPSLFIRFIIPDISSMTPKERRQPDIIKANRKKRIAAGSGTSVQEINKLLKQFDDMTTMMKRMNKLGQKGLMRHGLGALMPGGGGMGGGMGGGFGPPGRR